MARWIMASCSPRSICGSSPCRPKPALLTMTAGSSPKWVSSCAIRAGASERCRSATMTCGLYSADTAISVAGSVISFSRRATSATSWPLRANTRASSAPIPTEAPVTTVTGLKIDVAILSPVALALRAAAFRGFAGNAPAQRDAVARGDPKQIGSAPHQVILELIDAPIREHDFPHHLHDTEAAGFIE